MTNPTEKIPTLADMQAELSRMAWSFAAYPKLPPAVQAIPYPEREAYFRDVILDLVLEEWDTLELLNRYRDALEAARERGQA